MIVAGFMAIMDFYSQFGWKPKTVKKKNLCQAFGSVLHIPNNSTFSTSITCPTYSCILAVDLTHIEPILTSIKLKYSR